MVRRMRVGVLAGAVIVLGMTGADARGQALDTDQDIADEMAAMRRDLKELREENTLIKRSLDELKAHEDDAWLTEARAEEIRVLIGDVLADADTRASTLQSGFMAGWNEHFFLASPDGRFRIQLDGQLQVRWGYNYRDAPDRHRHGFELTRTKLTMRGHVFGPDLTFLVRTDKTRNEPGLVEGLFFLRDAWISYQLNNDWSVKFGLFKVPFSREELVSSAYQMAVERSLVNENTNLGRSEGVQFTHATDFDKLMFMYSDGATDNLGGFTIAGGNPVNTSFLVEDVEWAITARWEHLYAGDWRQFADLTSPPNDEFGALLGIGLHAEYGEFTGRGFRREENRWIAGTIDLSLELGGANLFAAVIYHYVDAPNFNANIYGLVVQAGVYVTPKVEVFSRFEYGFWDIDSGTASFSVLSVITVGANYYLDGHDVKWTTDIGFGIDRVDTNFDSDLAGYRNDPEDAEPQVVFRTQFQLLF